MESKHNGSEGAEKVFQIAMPEHSDGLQIRLFKRLFKDRCDKCNLPSYVEIESPPKIELPKLKLEFGLACGFWLARRDFAEMLCAEFDSQFEMRKIADDACFLILKNVLISDDPKYKDHGDYDPFFRKKEIVCSLCGQPYILLWKGIASFKGGNRIKRRTICETSIKFATADVKYPYYYCDEEAAYALRAISRKFKFVKSIDKLSVDAR